MSEPILVAESLGKTYPLPKGELRVFEGLSFSLEKGELVAIMGASGVGKTTLLNLLGALDRPTEGRVLFEGQDIFARPDEDVAALRNRNIGFVFQMFHLLPEFTALENAAFPLMIRRVPRAEAFDRALEALRDVGLEDRAQSRPSQLSGGEQQRVAIARALANGPRLLLADEPTGNLDWRTGERVLQLIMELHARRSLSSVIVTHNERIARACHRILLLEAGELKPLSLLPG